jgi:hypothetical protein
MLKISIKDDQSILDQVSSELAFIIYKKHIDFVKNYQKVYKRNQNDMSLDFLWEDEKKRIKKEIETFCAVRDLHWDDSSINGLVIMIMYCNPVFGSILSEIRMNLSDTLVFPLKQASRSINTKELALSLAGIAYNIIKNTYGKYQMSNDKGSYMHINIFPQFKKSFEEFFRNNNIEITSTGLFALRDTCYVVYTYQLNHWKSNTLFEFLVAKLDTKLKILNLKMPDT